MIKEALQYIVGLSEPRRMDIGSLAYADKHMEVLRSYAQIAPMETGTLQSVADYVREKVDEDSAYSQFNAIIHVADERTVYIYDELNADAYRQCRVVAKAVLPQIRLNTYCDLESMNIMLQSNFIASPERDMVLAIIGSITDGQVTDHQDDGISQKVTVRAGITRVGLEDVPNPVELAPYRTFLEVEQPQSLFVLRLQSGREQPQAGLFEADGGAWRMEARRGIFEFLSAALAEEISTGRVVVLA